jgi:predicted RNA-binding protein associated with RNAse of E/G family
VAQDVTQERAARAVLGKARLCSTSVSGNRPRPSGSPPYWPTGAQIIWRSGEGSLAAGAAATNDGCEPVPIFAEPVTVVRDDADSLIVWLAVGTPVLRVARADGLGKRDDKSTLFTAATVQDIGVHAWYDILRIAPTGRPWSVWVFFTEHTRQFAGWYVNLEDPHTRDEHAVYTRDHVLDLEIAPDRTMVRKDQDELALAVAQGRFAAAAAAAIEANAAEAEAIVADWGPPFCDGWEYFEPDPSWPIPELQQRWAR